MNKYEAFLAAQALLLEIECDTPEVQEILDRLYDKLVDMSEDPEEYEEEE